MPAFKENIFPTIQSKLATLRDRMTDHNIPDITAEDMLRLVCDDRTYDIINTAQDVIHVNWCGSSMTLLWTAPKVGVFPITVTLLGNKRLPAPKHPYPIRERQPEVAAKIDDWLVRQYNIKRGYSRAFKIFEMLNNACDSPEQIKYVWPSALALTRFAYDTCDDTKKCARLETMVNRMESFKTLKTAPSLPKVIWQPMRDAATWIASALIMDDKTTQAPASWVSLGMLSINDPYIDEGGFTYIDR